MATSTITRQAPQGIDALCEEMTELLGFDMPRDPLTFIEVFLIGATVEVEYEQEISYSASAVGRNGEDIDYDVDTGQYETVEITGKIVGIKRNAHNPKWSDIMIEPAYKGAPASIEMHYIDDCLFSVG